MFSQDFGFVFKRTHVVLFSWNIFSLWEQDKILFLDFLLLYFLFCLPSHFLFPSPHSTRKSIERLNTFDSKNLNTSNIFFQGEKHKL